MKRGTFEFIEETLVDYPYIDKHIKDRIEELTYPVTIVDENIGGGRSEKRSDPTFRIAATITDDLLIANLKHNKFVVDSVLEELDPKAKEVIELYYMQKPRKYTWAGVSDQTGYSEKQCRNIRGAIFKQIAKKLGLPT